MMNKDNLKKSKTFCMAPWTHMHFMPNKDVNPCCLSPIDQTIGNLNDQSIHDVWNSEQMKQLRTNMLEGKDCSNFCHRCYEKEEDGFTSLRTHMNDTYLDNHWDIVKNTTSNGKVENLNLVHWDFRFSNICNQRCRTCGIEFSTQWHDDYIKLWDIPAEKAPPKVKKIWKDVDSFERDFETLFDKVEYIHFAGGEPLITDEHYRVLEKLIEKGRTDITIRYSTNFGVLKYKKYDILEMWKPFKRIELMASIDDCGERYNYLRKGGDWNKVVENFNNLKETGLFKNKNIRWGLHPTISFWNIYYMPEFHQECIKLGMIDIDEKQNHFSTTFHLNNLIFPEYYNCQILPQQYKEKVTEKLLNYANKLENDYNINSTPFRNIVTYMNSEDKTDQLRKTRYMTQRLDAIRKENSKEVFPFLEDLFE